MLLQLSRGEPTEITDGGGRGPPRGGPRVPGPPRRRRLRPPGDLARSPRALQLPAKTLTSDLVRAGVRGARVLLRDQPRRGRRPDRGGVRGEQGVLRPAHGGEDEAAEAQLPGVHAALRREARCLFRVRRSDISGLVCSSSALGAGILV